MNENTDAAQGAATLVAVKSTIDAGRPARGAAAAVDCGARCGAGAGAPSPRWRCVVDRTGWAAEAADQDGR